MESAWIGDVAIDICSYSILFGLEVAPFVMLSDPNQNEFELAVEKKNVKV